MKSRKLLLLIGFCLTASISAVVVSAQNLDSNNYTIVNPTVNSGGGVATSSGYSLLLSIGESGADPRLESSNYAARPGFPNSFQANVPTINCFETMTDEGDAQCSVYPNGAGMIYECGEPGCYDRAKLEIDDQNNPTDTLYLVSLSTDSFSSEIFFLQADHTIDDTFDINSYMTQCELEGIDNDDPSCDDSGDANWNEDLQSYNVIGLQPATAYQVIVRAVHGDFTETQYSPTASASTTFPSIGLDLDVASTDTESASPYSINLGSLQINQATTADKSIWLDISTNLSQGVGLYVNNLGEGLFNDTTDTSINSETEDLDLETVDGGYGMKLMSIAQSSLGPLQSSLTYTTAGTNSVGALSASPVLALYTDSTGENRGQLFNGRGRFNVIARSYPELPAGIYTDSLTFVVLSN